MKGAAAVTFGAAAVTLALALGGCSLGGGDEEPRIVRGAPREVAEVVFALERAVQRGDWRTLCDELFTAGARRRAGGRDCARLLRDTGREVRRARIELLRIEVHGDRAEAKVRSRAGGQRPLVDTVELLRERGEYRIDALSG